MIPIVVVQIAARWGQAAALLILSAAATASAVAVPLFAAAVDQASTAAEVAESPRSELLVSLPALRAGAGQPAGDDDAVPTGPAAEPEDLAAMDQARAELMALAPVTTVEIRVQRSASEAPVVQRLLARDGFCVHTVFVQGRCPVGNREVAVPAGLVDEAGVAAGDTVSFVPVIQNDSGGWEPDGPPASFAVVGVVEPADPSDPYWYPQEPFGGEVYPAAFLTNRNALQTLPHGHSTYHVDAILPPDALTPDAVPALRAQLAAAQRRLAEVRGDTAELSTGLPQLLERVATHRDDARALLPVAATPLVVVTYLVLYLAVRQGLAGRRPELAAVALRSPPRGIRAVVFAAESLLPIVAGIAVGVVAAPTLIDLVSPAGSARAALGIQELITGGVAGVGALLVVLVALRRELSASVVQLLRRLPRSGRAVVATGEALVVGLAAAVAADLVMSDGELTGVMVAAPAIVMLATALLVTRAARVILRAAGRRAKRRGRLGPGVAALYLVRRPGTIVVMVVLAVSAGTLGYAAASVDVAAQGRADEVRRELGSARVLDIERAGRTELLTAVREADPTGKYAMAAVVAPAAAGDPPMLAVDSTRLGEVALWSDEYGELDADEVARLLRPPPPREPLTVLDGELTAEFTPGPYTDDGAVTAALLLVPPAGDAVVAGFEPITAGRQRYQVAVDGCAAGCRLGGLVFIRVVAADVVLHDVTLHSLHQAGRPVIPDDRLVAEAWHGSEESEQFTQPVTAETTADGLRVSIRGEQPEDGYVLRPLDVPYPLPAVATADIADAAGAAGRVGSLDVRPAAEPGADGMVVPGIDGRAVRIDVRSTVAALPGIGVRGTLIDLEYAIRSASWPGPATAPQVWLTADAPAEVLDRLRETGLAIDDVRTLEGVRSVAESTGSALALRFHLLATGVVVLVALGALASVVAVDRRTWRPGLRSLRVQGASRRTATSMACWLYGTIVATSVVAGLVAAGVAWLVTGARLPLGVDEALLAAWPEWYRVAEPLAWLTLVLLVAAATGAWTVAGERPRGRPGSRRGTEGELQEVES
ncbi:hypothetical protein [Phytoactinopolyspora halotolerans]|uniref:FtsX-like permease family protein n=1 Tax=Phytoactinopolyspora halotolerans TaxID=1981512 RepID=A0A6L9S466_9ACTN|nr:hypothetical protein [Phytoactinopolyspora halotolerans]NED99838.1 hypothetical protein [Phytoactinopolyspora halotolerans]